MTAYSLFRVGKGNVTYYITGEPKAGNWVGVLLVLSGVATAAFAIINFERVRQGVDYGEVRFSPTLALTTGGIVIVVSVLLALYLVITGPGIG